MATMLADYKQIDKRVIMKNQNRSAAFGMASNEITCVCGGGGGGGLQLVDQHSPLVLPWFLRHLLVRFACKIPRSYMYYLRNIEIRIKTKIKQT